MTKSKFGLIQNVDIYTYIISIFKMKRQFSQLSYNSSYSRKTRVKSPLILSPPSTPPDTFVAPATFNEQSELCSESTYVAGTKESESNYDTKFLKKSSLQETATLSQKYPKTLLQFTLLTNMEKRHQSEWMNSADECLESTCESLPSIDTAKDSITSEIKNFKSNTISITSVSESSASIAASILYHHSTSSSTDDFDLYNEQKCNDSLNTTSILLDYRNDSTEMHRHRQDQVHTECMSNSMDIVTESPLSNISPNFLSCATEFDIHISTPLPRQPISFFYAIYLQKARRKLMNQLKYLMELHSGQIQNVDIGSVVYCQLSESYKRLYDKLYLLNTVEMEVQIRNVKVI